MNRSNYTVFGAVTKKKRLTYSKPVPIQSVSYNANTRIATIILSKPYKGLVQATVKSVVLAANGLAIGASVAGSAVSAHGVVRCAFLFGAAGNLGLELRVTG